MSEFSRIYDSRNLPADPVRIEADAEERAALATRFDLVAVHSLIAECSMVPDGKAIVANGRMTADVVQSCAVSGEDLPQHIAEAIALRFVPEGAPPRPDEEVELDAGDCDEITMQGTSIDLGEAVAQSLALAIDPFATGPQAEEARRKAGLVDEAASGAFAALAALRKKD